MHLGVLQACFLKISGEKYCAIQLFEEMLGGFGEAILSDLDCPLLILTKDPILVPPTALLHPVSVCHQCSDS